MLDEKITNRAKGVITLVKIVKKGFISKQNFYFTIRNARQS